MSDRTVGFVRLWTQNCGAVFPQDADLGKIVERAMRRLSGAAREDLGELQLIFAIGMSLLSRRCGREVDFLKESRSLVTSSSRLTKLSRSGPG